MAGKNNKHLSTHHTHVEQGKNGDQGVKERQSNSPSQAEFLTPTFNLKAVVTETGLKPDTLRAWERRYGLPQPDRTAGGHRLYSQRDIDLIKWLIARQEEGMSISHAVSLWKQIEESGEDPLQNRGKGMGEVSPSVASVRSGDNLAMLRQAWIDACKEFDERKADNILAEAFSLFPTETVCFELLQRGLAEVGMGWYEGRITVQQEHFASALAIRRLETMVASTPPPSRNGRILAACPPEERHTFALLLLTLLLRRNGWDVVYLGANVPAARLESTLSAADPHLVILSAQTLYTASTMLPMAMLLQRERVVSTYGGAVFSHIPALRQYMPGYFLGNRLEQVPTVVEQLLTSPPPMPMYDQPSRSYRLALQHFQERQAAIDARVWESLSHTNQGMYLKNANSDLGQNIVAALTFGDMNLLSSNLDWVEGLLVNYHYRLPAQMLREYIKAYHDAAKEAMDERGDVITQWLQKVVES